MMINWKGVTAAVAMMAASGALAAPAASASVLQTVTYMPSCSASGFTGTLKIVYREPTKGRADLIYSLDYKIDKHSQSGGNKANVTWQDGGTMPTTVRGTGDNGIQDGYWHSLNTSYYRGSGATAMKFIFDESGPGDPRCQMNTGINH